MPRSLIVRLALPALVTLVTAAAGAGTDPAPDAAAGVDPDLVSPFTSPHRAPRPSARPMMLPRPRPRAPR